MAWTLHRHAQAVVLRERLLVVAGFAAALLAAVLLVLVLLVVVLFAAVLLAVLVLFEADVERVRGVAGLRAGAVRRLGTRTYSTANGFKSISAFRMPIE